MQPFKTLTEYNKEIKYKIYRGNWICNLYFTYFKKNWKQVTITDFAA